MRWGRQMGWALLLGVAVADAADSSARASAVVELSEVVVLTGDAVRVGDLSSTPLDPRLAEQVVVSSPAPGRERRVSKDTLRRLMVQAGVDPLPRLDGATSVLLRRLGRTLDSGELGRRLETLLAQDPLPPFALAQRIRVRGVREVSVPEGPVRVVLDGPVPRVGKGSVAFRVTDSTGRSRRHFARVQRKLRTVAMRTLAATERGAALGASTVRADTLWVTDPLQWDRLVRPRDDLAGGWTFVRSVPGDHVLRTQDLRPTPVVQRGELVDWIVRRGDATITLTVRARRNGATGDWILVENPLDGRLRRVVVLGPGRVADHPPRSGARARVTQDDYAERAHGETP